MGLIIAVLIADSRLKAIKPVLYNSIIPNLFIICSNAKIFSGLPLISKVKILDVKSIIFAPKKLQTSKSSVRSESTAKILHNNNYLLTEGI